MTLDGVLAARRAIEANDPPIEVGQVWSIRSDEPQYTRYDGVVRALRILGDYPERLPNGDHLLICEDAPGVLSAIHERGRVFRMPEFNLRYVYEWDRELS